MIQNQSSDGFEYKNKDSESPFETFLRYTNEKAASSEKLAEILQSGESELNILDIGTGNGEYLELTLDRISETDSINLTLLEPSSDLAAQVANRISGNKNVNQIRVINTDLDDFSTEEKFDVVLTSHLFYHIPRQSWPEQLLRMMSFVKPGGRLIIVLREKDDAYEFKMAFKPLLFDSSFQALTLDDVLAAVPELNSYKVARVTAESELKIPFTSNLSDTESIIEFYLNLPWAEIPKSVQDESLKFIAERKGVFHQIDGIAVLKK